MTRTKKIKSNVVKDIHVNVFDLRLTGPEPVFNPAINYRELDFMMIYNWYNYVVPEQDRLKMVLEYHKEDQDAIRANVYIPNVISALCRLKTRGWPLAQREATLQKGILYLIEQGKKELAKNKKVATPVKRGSVQAENNIIADFEDMIDKEQYNVDVDAYIEQNTGPSLVKSCKAVVKYYKPLLDELDLAITKKDKEVVEGYVGHKPKQLKEYRRFINNIIETCDKWSKKTKKVAQRKPRRKKPVLPAKQVERIKFLREEKELGLVSIEPVKIIDAHELWLYNTRTRMLQHYESDSGLKVKGTTLQGYSDKSEAKKMRKPEDIKNLIDQGPKSIIKDFTALKTKGYACNGRFNEFTLILKASK